MPAAIEHNKKASRGTEDFMATLQISQIIDILCRYRYCMRQLLLSNIAAAISHTSTGTTQPMILTMACVDSDRTRRLVEGTIGIDGYELRLATMPFEEMFRRAFEAAEFDISELSASTFLLHAG